MLRRVQADESLHLSFYRDAAKAALQQQPSLAAIALDEIRRFREPVAVLPDYETRKEQIWRTGISDLAVFRTHVIKPLLEHWNLDVGQLQGRW